LIALSARVSGEAADREGSGSYLQHWKLSDIVSYMESISPAPDAAAAAKALAEIESAQRAVRDTPWPVWLYPVNAVLLGAMALTTLLDEHSTKALLAIALAVVAVNVLAGLRIGTPWALPTSRGFLTAVAVSAGLLGAALVTSGLTDRAWPVVLLAAGTTVSYLVGSVLHHRSTRR
jgi:hypothetical protein